MTDESERDAIQTELRALIERQKQVTFTDPAAPTSTDERTLAVMISRFARWDGDRISDIAAEAFEDANFHDVAHILREAVTA